jgi:glycosyltransferase involved in cell wall biosynthesis
VTRRVVHVIDRLGVGGAEYLLVTAAQQAPRVGWDLTVLTLGPAQQSPVPDLLRELGVAVEEVHSQSGRSLLDPARAVRLRARLAELQPEVVHTHLAYSNTLAPRLSPRGVPVVTTLHNVGGGVRSGQAARDRLERWSLRRGSDVLLGVGPAVAAAQSARLGRPVHVLVNPVAPPPPIEPDDVRDARRALLAGSDGPLLLAAGRLNEQKGFDDLLRAFAAVAASRPDAVLAIAGRGHLADELEKLSADLGLGGSVRFLGPRDDLRTLMRAADLFVSSSRWEGLPLVLLEVMEAGTPLVATDVGDVAYAVGDAALLVPASAPDALSAAVLEVLGDPAGAGARSAAGRERVARRHSAEAWADATEDVYRTAGGRS